MDGGRSHLATRWGHREQHGAVWEERLADSPSLQPSRRLWKAADSPSLQPSRASWNGQLQGSQLLMTEEHVYGSQTDLGSRPSSSASWLCDLGLVLSLCAQHPHLYFEDNNSTGVDSRLEEVIHV